MRSAPALNAGGAPVRTRTRAVAASRWAAEEPQQRGVVDRVAALRSVQRDDEHAGTPVTVVSVPGHPYHAADSMSEVTDDPIRRRRAQVARWTSVATRTGYALLLVAVVVFFVALVVGFSATMATLVLVPLLVSFVLLAPAIVIGYAVKAAERDDRERGI